MVDNRACRSPLPDARAQLDRSVDILTLDGHDPLKIGQSIPAKSSWATLHKYEAAPAEYLTAPGTENGDVALGFEIGSDGKVSEMHVGAAPILLAAPDPPADTHPPWRSDRGQLSPQPPRIAVATALGGSRAVSTIEKATARAFTFGTLPDGRAVPAVTLANARGVSATVIAYGAALQALILPDRDGNPADIVLGYDTIGQYVDQPQYFGTTVGRFANRIAGGRFTLDGREYRLPVNDGSNSLHGGAQGLDRVLWSVTETVEGAAAPVTLRYVSPDGDQGYPGTLTVEATYALDDRNHLTIDYRATTDAPTIVNLSNHVYWALSGEGSAAGAMGNVLTIPADTFLPTDAAAIPTGEFAPVAGTPFDFRSPHVIGDRVRDARDRQIAFGRGYDHNWVFGRTVTHDQHLMARLADPASGRGFELWSNQPGLQFYSGNFLDGTSYGKARRLYRAGDAIALEPQIVPDTPNRPEFGSARLAPGEVYRNTITYRLTTGAG